MALFRHSEGHKDEYALNELGRETRLTSTEFTHSKTSTMKALAQPFVHQCWARGSGSKCHQGPEERGASVGVLFRLGFLHIIFFTLQTGFLDVIPPTGPTLKFCTDSIHSFFGSRNAF